MTRTTRRSSAADATVESHVARGDRHLFAEQYDEAEACYRVALEQGTGDTDVAAKLERAAAAAATGLADGEAQREVFLELFSRERLLGGPDLEPSPEPPPALGVERGGAAAVAHDASIKLGHVAGAVGSFVLHQLTELAGRRGTNDAVWTNWHSSGKGLPPAMAKVVQILKLAHMRETLFANNLVRPYPDGAKTAFYGTSTPPPPEALRWRMADGSWNKITPGPDGRYDPMVGAAYTRFFRNVGDDRGLDAVRPRGDEATSPVSVRELSRALFAPTGERQLVPFLNLWAAVWIQFMNNGWVSHGSSDAGRVAIVPLAEDDPIRRRYGLEHLEVRRTPEDPTRQPADGNLPPTFINEVTHWWDGSQLYGSDRRTQTRVRSGVGGKLTVTDDGLLPVDPESGTELTGFTRNWWVALGAIHTLFVREHNSICDMLSTAYPDWGDEALFQTARLVNAAVMAKIHTVEWTPAILPNETLYDGMLANWYGLITNLFGGKRKKALEEIPITNRELGGIVGNPQARFADFGLSEEFTAVYRMHSLLPDSVRVYKPGETEPVADIPLMRTRHAASPALISEHGIENIARSMGVQLAGALVNNNYPAAMLDMPIPGEAVVDLGAIDLFRDRERGVPPYNTLRAELGLNRVGSFDELTEDAALAAKLRSLYGQHVDGSDRVEDMDLLVGTLCEGHRPPGFGFGETLFQIFILNASWRLLGDRFYTDDYREGVYTREGLDWIDNVTMKSVLLRHFPSLASSALANVGNAFEPWDEGRLDPRRHPLRAFDSSIDGDPWAGDSAG
ncbi:MAG: peroxidase family protein [Pseudonocardiales bacterium]